MFYQTWRFIWTSGIAKLNAFCDWCSSVAYCSAVRLWVVSMVDSDGSVDDPDAPNQITEGSRRQPFYTFCFRFVLNAHNPRKLMPSVSSTNGQQDHIPSRARGRMVMWEGIVWGVWRLRGGGQKGLGYDQPWWWWWWWWRWWWRWCGGSEEG